MSHSFVIPSTHSEADDCEERKMQSSVSNFLSGYDVK